MMHFNVYDVLYSQYSHNMFRPLLRSFLGDVIITRTQTYKCRFFLCSKLQHGYHSNPTTPKFQHTSNQEQYDHCGNSAELSQAPDDGYIKVRNMLST